MSTDSTDSKSSRGKWLLFAGLVLIVAAAFVFGNPKEWLNRVIAAVEGLGAWGPVVYVLAYVVAAVLMVPGSALTLAAGTLFGLGLGTALVSLASTAGAAAAFLVGRFLARDAVAARIAKKPAFAALDKALEKEGWKIVLLTRLSPVFPYTLLNYAFGLTRVKFLHYIAASWVAMLPATVLFVYLGSLARAGVRGSGKSPLEWSLYGAGLVATVAVTFVITRLAKRSIAKAGLEPDAGEGGDAA